MGRNLERFVVWILLSFNVAFSIEFRGRVCLNAGFNHVHCISLPPHTPFDKLSCCDNQFGIRTCAASLFFLIFESINHLGA